MSKVAQRVERMGHRTIAARSGLTHSHINRVFRGLKRLSLDSAVTVAKVLDVSLEELASHLASTRKKAA